MAQAKQKRTRVPRLSQVETTVEAAVSDAFSEFTTLQEEMESWRDNMEEKLSHTEKYERVSEAADALSNLSEPEVPQILHGVKITYTHDRKATSRAARCSEAVNMLNEVINAAQGFIDAEQEKKEKEQRQELIDEVQSFIDELQGYIDEAEGVEFPGMYG